MNSSEMSEEMLTYWSELKSMIEALEFDLHKHAVGCCVAGNRFRRGLRDAFKHANSIRKISIEKTKLIRAERGERLALLDSDADED